MIGIEVIGVSKLPPHPERKVEPYPARSSIDVPELIAWWIGLENSGVIEHRGSRVRIGKAGEEFLGQQDLPMVFIDRVVSVMVGIALYRRSFFTFEGFDFVEGIFFEFAVVELAHALQAPPETLPRRPKPLLHAVEECLDGLTRLGLIEKHENGYFVPPEWRVPVARGVMDLVDYAQGR